MVGMAGTTGFALGNVSRTVGLQKKKIETSKGPLPPSNWDMWWQCDSSTASGLMMQTEGKGEEQRVRNRVQHDMKDRSN